MKKTLLILVLMFHINSVSQCEINNLLPFEIGQTKFDITKTLNSLEKITKSSGANNANSFEKFNNGWKKYDYLKNDSIYHSYILLNHLKDECYNGSENKIKLSFADDRLYNILVIQEYDKTRFEEMMMDYDKYIKIFLDSYPYSSGFTTTNSKTNEKIGEGGSFFLLPEEKRNKTKVERISVSYTINYKMLYDDYKKEYITTSDVDFYTIEIESVNLANTKLTNKGF